MRTHFLNRFEDNSLLAKPEPIRCFLHKRLLGLVTRFVQRKHSRAALIVLTVDRAVLIAVQMLTVTRKRN